VPELVDVVVVVDDDDDPPSDDTLFCFVADTVRNGILFCNTVLLFLLPTDTPDSLVVVVD
jgi:hypothetical protein